MTLKRWLEFTFRRPRIIAVIAVKNEERYLPGFFSHLRGFVDGFVVLDDASSDATPDIIAREEKVLSFLRNPPGSCPYKKGWDEKGNRMKLLAEARRFGDVALCCDADERFSRRFLAQLPKSAARAARHERTAYAVAVRELWDAPDTWRCDGIWAKKRKEVLFSLAPEMTFERTMTRQHHIPWYHDGIKKCRMVPGGELFHLKMIRPEERQRRAEFYESIDPGHKMQAIGYAYLADPAGLELKKISPSDYDWSSV